MECGYRASGTRQLAGPCKRWSGKLGAGCALVKVLQPPLAQVQQPGRLLWLQRQSSGRRAKAGRNVQPSDFERLAAAHAGASGQDAARRSIT